MPDDLNPDQTGGADGALEIQDPPEGGDTGAQDNPPGEGGGDTGDQPEGGQPQKTETPEEESVTLSKEEYDKLAARAGFADREARRRKLKTYTEPVAAEPPKPETPKPKRESFDDYDEFVEALTDWKVEQREIKERQATAAKSRREHLDDFHSFIDEQEAKDPEFTKKAYIPVDMNNPRGLALYEMIANSDQLAEIALHFGANNSEAVRLYDLAQRNPVAAAREIGKLEISLSKRTPQQRTKTNAPSPTKTVAPGGKTQKSLDDMSTEEFIAHRNAEEKARLRGG
jgi:hypothetical protein